jgi:hypothetical protein
MAILLGSLSGGMQPSAPTIGTATAGNTTASVAFTPSTYIGKGTITYTATSSPGGLTGTSATSPITVTGLTNGTAYTFTVVGNTNYGVASVASAASNSITPAPTTAPVYDSISSYLATSTVSDITLSSIPSTYRHLQIRVMGFSNNFGTIFMEINGDTTLANYQSTGIWGQQNLANAQTSGILRGRPAIIAGVGSFQFGTTYPYVLIIDMLDYKNTNKAKMMRSFHGASSNSTHYNDGVGLGGGVWSGTAAINSLRFFLDGGNNYTAGTRISLYGIKE